MRDVGKSFWYVIVYLAMCFAAAAFQAKRSMSGVSEGDLEW